MSDKMKSLTEYIEDRLLQRTDSYFFGIGHSVDAFVWAATPDGKLDYVNSYFNQIIGQSLLGTSVWDWPEVVHPEDLPRLISLVRSSMAKPVRFQAPARLRTNTGQYVPFMVRGTYVPRSDESVHRWVGTAVRTDVPNPEIPSEDELKNYIMGMTEEQRRVFDEDKSGELYAREISARMARRFALLAEESIHLSSSLDIHTILQNLARLTVPRLADWVGVMELLPGQTLINLAHFHRNPGWFHSAMAAAIKYPPEGTPKFGSYYTIQVSGRAQLLQYYSTEHLTTMGKTSHIQGGLMEAGVRSVIVAPMKVRGRIIGTVSFSSASSKRIYDESDIDFAQEIANRLGLAIDHANAYAEAQRINHAKDEFLATLSHEMRTPLNVIMGYSELLRTGWHSMPFTEIQSSLETIYRNSHTQLRIVDDLLNMSSMILGNVSLSLSRFSVTELVQHAVDSLLVMWKSKNLKIALDFDKAPPIVTADAPRIQQIVLNLLTNAIKYTPVDGRVDVKVEADGPNFTLTVRDTGVGIEPEYLPSVFDRFSQEDSSTTRSFGGLGLGLAIVRNLVELHGGVVEAHSDGRDRGSTFIVTLPIGASLPLPNELGTGFTPVKKSDSSDLKGIRVLLVEDDLDTRTLVRRYLERAGARVLEARSAAEGFQMLQHGHPHLILSDIGMPEEDGISFIKRVRSLDRAPQKFTPAAALTAFTRPEDSERALSAGFQIYIVKPANKAKLISALSELVQQFPMHGVGPG